MGRIAFHSACALQPDPGAALGGGDFRGAAGAAGAAGEVGPETWAEGSGAERPRVQSSATLILCETWAGTLHSCAWFCSVLTYVRGSYMDHSERLQEKVSPSHPDSLLEG